jgi:hypothetical protein
MRDNPESKPLRSIDMEGKAYGVSSAAAKPVQGILVEEKGGADPVGIRADMRLCRTRGPSVLRC